MITNAGKESLKNEKSAANTLRGIVSTVGTEEPVAQPSLPLVIPKVEPVKEVEPVKLPFKICNGIYTIENTKTGEHRTFRISTIPKGYKKGARTVALLKGPDNTNDYQKFAYLNDRGQFTNIHVWPSFRMTEQEKAEAKRRNPKNQNPKNDWEKFADILISMLLGEEKYIKAGLVLHESRLCMRCNKVLTVPESVSSGLGPECIKKGYL